MLPAYPVYRRVNKKAKDGVRDEILNLSEKILNS
jgi:hypothetical protein